MIRKRTAYRIWCLLCDEAVHDHRNQCQCEHGLDIVGAVAQVTITARNPLILVVFAFRRTSTTPVFVLAFFVMLNLRDYKHSYLPWRSSRDWKINFLKVPNRNNSMGGNSQSIFRCTSEYSDRCPPHPLQDLCIPLYFLVVFCRLFLRINIGSIVFAWPHHLQKLINHSRFIFMIFQDYFCKKLHSIVLKCYCVQSISFRKSSCFFTNKLGSKWYHNFDCEKLAIHLAQVLCWLTWCKILLRNLHATRATRRRPSKMRQFIVVLLFTADLIPR